MVCGPGLHAVQKRMPVMHSRCRSEHWSAVTCPGPVQGVWYWVMSSQSGL